jgi:hypothetical protein
MTEARRIEARRNRDARRSWRAIELLLNEKGLSWHEFGKRKGDRQWGTPSRRHYSWLGGKTRFPSMRTLSDALEVMGATMVDFCRCYGEAINEESKDEDREADGCSHAGTLCLAGGDGSPGWQHDHR